MAIAAGATGAAATAAAATAAPTTATQLADWLASRSTSGGRHKQNLSQVSGEVK